MQEIKLTNSEKEIMKLLWEIKKPLSGSEIVSLSEGKTWKESYIHLLINSLLDKEIIKVDGFIKTAKNYARTFIPTVSEEEYLVGQMLSNSQFREDHIPFVVKKLLSGIENKAILEEVKAYVNGL